MIFHRDHQLSSWHSWKFFITCSWRKWQVWKQLWTPNEIHEKNSWNSNMSLNFHKIHEYHAYCMNIMKNCHEISWKSYWSHIYHEFTKRYMNFMKICHEFSFWIHCYHNYREIHMNHIKFMRICHEKSYYVREHHEIHNWHESMVKLAWKFFMIFIVFIYVIILSWQIWTRHELFMNFHDLFMKMT